MQYTTTFRRRGEDRDTPGLGFWTYELVLHYAEWLFEDLDVIHITLYDHGEPFRIYLRPDESPYDTAKRKADAYTERTGKQAFVYRGREFSADDPTIDWIDAYDYYHYRPEIHPQDILYSTWEGEYID